MNRKSVAAALLLGAAALALLAPPAPVATGKMKSYWTVQHRNSAGDMLWECKDQPNLLHYEGERALLSAYFATTESGFGAPPASLYLGLRTNTAANGDSLASGLTEVAGTGYARIALSTTTDFTLSQSTDWRATSGNKVFTATGTWTGAVAMFVCTVSSGTAGKLILSAPLSTTRTLVNGDTLTASCYIVMSQ